MKSQLLLRAKQVKRLEAIKAYIADNLDKDLSIGVLADLFKIGSSTLRNHFYTYFNTTVHECVVNGRMEKAKILLAQNVATINDISNMVGFNERNAFTRAFKKHMHCSPLQYIRAANLQKRQNLTNSSTLDIK